MLGYIESLDAEKLDDYRIKVHGIKGACYDVYADLLADRAKELEYASIAGDFEFINNNNSGFIETAREFLDKIDSLLSDISSEKADAEVKPKKEKIDNELLSNLIEACKEYDMSGVDAAMEEIEVYEYGSDKELSVWLRENVDLINFADIIDKLDESN